MNFDGSQFTPNFSHTALPISHILTPRGLGGGKLRCIGQLHVRHWHMLRIWHWRCGDSRWFRCQQAGNNNVSDISIIYYRFMA